MQTRCLIWTGLLSAALASSPAQAAGLPAFDAERYEAQAYPRGGGPMLYTETHWRYREGEVWQHLVLYGCPQSKGVFARKLLRESPTAQAPDFDFQDARDGYREGVRRREGVPGGVREVYVQAKSGAPVEAKPLVLPANAVLDAGFDAFVRANWSSLSAGASVKVPFLVPSRFEFLDFKIADARDAQIEGQPVRRLRMSFAAWYGFALPSLELAYTRDGARLVEFNGLGTIRDAQGNHQNVRIVFPEAARSLSPPASEIDAALARPLTPRCQSEARP